MRACWTHPHYGLSERWIRFGSERAFGDQRELAGAIESLDPRLLASGAGGIAHRPGEHELRRQAAGGVLACLAGRVRGQPPLHVGAPTGVQRPVRAAEHVRPRVRHRYPLLETAPPRTSPPPPNPTAPPPHL